MTQDQTQLWGAVKDISEGMNPASPGTPFTQWDALTFLAEAIMTLRQEALSDVSVPQKGAVMDKSLRNNLIKLITYSQPSGSWMALVNDTLWMLAQQQQPATWAEKLVRIKDNQPAPETREAGVVEGFAGLPYSEQASSLPPAPETSALPLEMQSHAGTPETSDGECGCPQTLTIYWPTPTWSRKKGPWHVSTCPMYHPAARAASEVMPATTESPTTDRPSVVELQAIVKRLSSLWEAYYRTASTEVKTPLSPPLAQTSIESGPAVHPCGCALSDSSPPTLRVKLSVIQGEAMVICDLHNVSAWYVLTPAQDAESTIES